ncbi:MAG: hypothetical protein WBZ07_02250 [Candidatus Dormiibacterota bacterium]
MAQTALLVMNVQGGVVAPYPEDSERLLKALNAATTAARSAGVTVIYVRVALPTGLPGDQP